MGADINSYIEVFDGTAWSWNRGDLFDDTTGPGRPRPHRTPDCRAHPDPARGPTVTTTETYDKRWQQIHCDRCGRDFQCTPWDDHYDQPDGTGVCEPCLLGGRPLLYLIEQDDGSLAGPFGPLAPLDPSPSARPEE